MLPVCRDLGIGFVPFSPLGRGFLSGAVKHVEALESGDVRLRLPRFQAENFQRNLELIRPLEEMARATQCSPSQLALAWVLAKAPDIVPIPGTKRRRNLEENVAATEISLSPADVARVGRATRRYRKP